MQVPHVDCLDVGTIFRNRLHTNTVRAIIKVKQGVASTGGCVNFVPSARAGGIIGSILLTGGKSVIHQTKLTSLNCLAHTHTSFLNTHSETSLIIFTK